MGVLAGVLWNEFSLAEGVCRVLHLGVLHSALLWGVEPRSSYFGTNLPWSRYV